MPGCARVGKDFADMALRTAAATSSISSYRSECAAAANRRRGARAHKARPTRREWIRSRDLVPPAREPGGRERLAGLDAENLERSARSCARAEKSCRPPQSAAVMSSSRVMNGVHFTFGSFTLRDWREPDCQLVLHAVDRKRHRHGRARRNDSMAGSSFRQESRAVTHGRTENSDRLGFQIPGNSVALRYLSMSASPGASFFSRMK